VAKTQTLPHTILILGATSAIAQATGRQLAEQGASFFLVARDAHKLSAVSDDLRTRGAKRVCALALDLDDLDAHADMLSSAAQTLGTIDLALLAHGVLGDQAAAEADARVAQGIYHTNFLSPASLITWLANYFEGRGQGCLAVISSVAGDRGRKSNYVYGASKGALTILLDGVRNRVDRMGVHVLTIKPGFVATPMTAHLPRGPLFAEPRTIARGILRAVAERRDTVYLPGFWRFLMFVVRAVPSSLFKNMNL
jgi:decaprenylphospho-beta-D-erythro-pentofuranosid-2-ulose 2-reductase